jgi:hypothetical protein
MAKTPEGEVKRAIRDVLERYEGMWFYMPVPSGYGRRTVDFIGIFRGKGFAIEAKRPGEEPNLNQQEELGALRNAGATTFVIDGVASFGMADLCHWLFTVHERVPHDPHLSPTQSRRRPV